MPRHMRPEALDRLHRATAAARAAEEVRLAGITRAIAACRDRAATLRETLAGAPPAPPAAAADLAATLRWQARLGAEARAELARAGTLAAEAEAARRRLARAFGRERAVAELLAQARRAQRREAEGRAEAANLPSTAGSPGGSD